MKTARLRLYREHKYVTSVLFDVCLFLGKADLQDEAKRTECVQKLADLKRLFASHGYYEESRLHARLTQRGSNIHERADSEHGRDLETLDAIAGLVKDSGDCPARAHQAYLEFRKFVADALLHLDFEETVILPELQNLYSDDELRLVDKESYDQMNGEQMFHMLQILFPTMNADDKAFFIDELHKAAPGKLRNIRSRIQGL